MNMENIVKAICDFIWSLPLLIALFGVGVYFSFKLNFVQIRHIKRAFGYILKSKKPQDNSDFLGDISNFASLCTALSATLGTGNIVGIAVAKTNQLNILINPFKDTLTLPNHFEICRTGAIILRLHASYDSKFHSS